MSKELSLLIVWPSRQQVNKTLPTCFKKLYPNVRCIIDCFECFTETPSGLDLAATLWSQYKHHYTFKGHVKPKTQVFLILWKNQWRKRFLYLFSSIRAR